MEHETWIKTMTASSISGGLTRIPCHPLDTIKARLQTQNWMRGPSGKLHNNFVQGLHTIFKEEGLRGLYRGFGPTVLGSIPASCLYFTTYEASKAFLEAGHDAFFMHMSCGLMAESVSCIMWVPIDVVKERMQIQSIPRDATIESIKSQKGDRFYSNGMDAFRSIIRSEGWIGFYRGYGATIASFGPFSALYFAFYEQLKQRLSSEHFGSFLMCGATAGAMASFCTNPLDIIKLRLQVQRLEQQKLYRNILHGLYTLLREEGIPGLFRGVGARMAFHAPATAINMAIFEQVRQML